MARAQLRYVVQDRSGNVQAGVTVTVCDPGTTDPITPTMFAAPTGGGTAANPLTSDANGGVLAFLDDEITVDLIVDDGESTVTIASVPVLAAAAPAGATPTIAEVLAAGDNAGGLQVVDLYRIIGAEAALDNPNQILFTDSPGQTDVVGGSNAGFENAFVRVEGAVAADARIRIKTDGSLGAMGEVLTAQGDDTAIWVAAPPVVPNFVDAEVPSGDIDGMNATFILANTPMLNSEHVYLNGLRLPNSGDNGYLMAGATITFTGTIPQPSDTVLVDYRWES